mmetsp:Transcript_76954/g.217696  ORF Transcript_76954/g.217696 Transcript_76954/m.217696 type:complete len:213 (-) Transcript_76954:167-805(-)
MVDDLRAAASAASTSSIRCFTASQMLSPPVSHPSKCRSSSRSRRACLAASLIGRSGAPPATASAEPTVRLVACMLSRSLCISSSRRCRSPCESISSGSPSSLQRPSTTWAVRPSRCSCPTSGTSSSSPRNSGSPNSTSSARVRSCTATHDACSRRYSLPVTPSAPSVQSCCSMASSSISAATPGNSCWQCAWKLSATCNAFRSVEFSITVAR